MYEWIDDKIRLFQLKQDYTHFYMAQCFRQFHEKFNSSAVRVYFGWKKTITNEWFVSFTSRNVDNIECANLFFSFTERNSLQMTFDNHEFEQSKRRKKHTTKSNTNTTMIINCANMTSTLKIIWDCFIHGISNGQNHKHWNHRTMRIWIAWEFCVSLSFSTKWVFA